MSSSTTNLGLTLPADGERLSLGVLNQNWNKVDEYAGGVNGQLVRLNPHEPAWTANANLNNYTQTGTYYLSTGRQNGVGGDWGMLQVIGGRADTFNQIYRANGRIFEREYRASQGWTEWKELAEKYAPISYYSLIDRVAISKVATDYTFYGNRSLATFPTISIQPIIGGYFRQGLVIPRNHFNSASNGKFSLTYPSGGENVEIVLNYVDDTKINMKYNATGTFNVQMIIDGLVNG